jgi:hypothetical protein
MVLDAIRKFGSPAWIRTTINGSQDCSATRRPTTTQWEFGRSPVGLRPYHLAAIMIMEFMHSVANVKLYPTKGSAFARGRWEQTAALIDQDGVKP